MKNQSAVLNESKAEYEDKYGDGEDRINGHSWNTLRVQKRYIVIFMFDPVSGRHFNYHNFIREPEKQSISLIRKIDLKENSHLDWKVTLGGVDASFALGNI